MAADGFDWDAGNRDKCLKHGLSLADIEHVVGHADTLIVADIKNSVFEERFIAVGRTLRWPLRVCGIHAAATRRKASAAADQRALYAQEGNREI